MEPLEMFRSLQPHRLSQSWPGWCVLLNHYNRRGHFWWFQKLGNKLQYGSGDGLWRQLAFWRLKYSVSWLMGSQFTVRNHIVNQDTKKYEQGADDLSPLTKYNLFLKWIISYRSFPNPQKHVFAHIWRYSPISWKASDFSGQILLHSGYPLLHNIYFWALSYLDNCLKYIVLYHCSPIQGTMPLKVKKTTTQICSVLLTYLMTWSPGLENNNAFQCKFPQHSNLTKIWNCQN